MFDRFLGFDDLMVVADLFSELAPRWSSELRVWKSSRDQTPIDIADPDALPVAVAAAAGHRGDTYRELVHLYGEPPLERFAGDAELRGAGNALTVVISLDRMVVSPLGSKVQLGNTIALQVRQARLEGEASATWTRRAFNLFCERLSPAWASAEHPDEYWAKVMSESPRIEALGRDFGRSLPGLFWLNFFGRSCLELVGRSRLEAAPGDEVRAVDSGILIRVGEDPCLWDSPESRATHERIIDHLGRALFFDKKAPHREGVVPKWGTD